MDNPGEWAIVGRIWIGIAIFLAILFFGRRIIRHWQPMRPIHRQSYFNYCTMFTVGVVLIATRSPGLSSLGYLLSFLALAVFLPENKYPRLFVAVILFEVGVFLAMLGQLEKDGPFFQPKKLPLWAAEFFGIVWSLGMLFLLQRWISSLPKKGAPPIISPGNIQKSPP